MDKVSFHPFEPIIFPASETLILGSFPSLKSFEDGFYYAHPRNQFWRLLSSIYEMPTDTIESKISLLRFAKIALWDSVSSCERRNSADTNLKNTKPNDIARLLTEYPSIKKLFFTGKTAETLYKKYFSNLSIETKLLPSPSPAYAAMSFDDKLKIWRNFLDTKVPALR